MSLGGRASLHVVLVPVAADILVSERGVAPLRSQEWAVKRTEGNGVWALPVASCCACIYVLCVLDTFQ